MAGFDGKVKAKNSGSESDGEVGEREAGFECAKPW
jgi:hypothetical protein